MIPANIGFVPSEVRVNSDAVYIQPEFHLTSQIDLILGARITQDRKDGRKSAPGSSSPTFSPSLGRSVPIRYRKQPADLSGRVELQAVVGRAGLPEVQHGYISGGQLATIAYAPETARSFEGGLKADLFDRRFREAISRSSMSITKQFSRQRSAF
ncbi:TonB-dependent receptor domain-containing protein [Sphingomonas sp. MMS24-JH45]